MIRNFIQIGFSTTNLIPLITIPLTLVFIPGAAIAVDLPGVTPACTSYSSADVVLLISYILLALVFSFLCSVAESVLLSITPSFIAGLRDRKPRLAALLKRLKQDNVDQSLAAILTLNTIAHTVGAIGSGAKATAVFGSAWFGLFSAAMTLMILFLSEIIPKTIGAVYWRDLAGLAALFVRGLIWSLYPLIWISEALTRFIARGKKAHAFNREEFVAMVGVGEGAGQIDQQESRVIRNLFRFRALRAEDIMTPRTVISALPQGLKVSEALKVLQNSAFSRLPLYQTNIDNITGFMLKNDLLLDKAKHGDEATLAALKRKILIVKSQINLSDLLSLFLENRQHIAMVADEFGGTKGLVTLEDVLETLLGLEIVDEMDQVEDMRVLARKKWAERAKGMGLKVAAKRTTTGPAAIDNDMNEPK